MDQFIQQDPFGSDQDEWDWCYVFAFHQETCRDIGLTSRSDRRISHCSIPDSKSIKDFKGEKVGAPYIQLPRDDCTLHHSSTTKSKAETPCIGWAFLFLRTRHPARKGPLLTIDRLTRLILEKQPFAQVA
ncbi:hypothetical protein QYF36_012185 [Acer negundo]|nr:hypothetical protein QYF36_012185 [Acer negundo]